MIDKDFLIQLTEAVSVGTACGSVISLLQHRFGAEFDSFVISDGFCLFLKRDTGQPGLSLAERVGKLRGIFVAHMDEVGGCAYGPDEDSGGFRSRFWGNRAQVFAGAELQAMDYLASNTAELFPITARVTSSLLEERLTILGAGIRPYRTVWTFKTGTTISGDTVSGKALDPRVTLYASVEAVRKAAIPEIGGLFVMAEECAMDVARKAVVMLQRYAGALELVVNADVPSVENLGEGRLDLPAIRIFEGRNFIDPSVGIRVSDCLAARGVEHHLSSARSGSQTSLFSPLAPTLSIALPGEGIHMPCSTMSLRGLERCELLLHAIIDALMAGGLHRIGVLPTEGTRD